MFKAMLIKEVILVLRDRHALAALFIMPSIFILIMSLALKDTFSNERALLNYAVIDRDNTEQSELLQKYLQTSPVLLRHEITETASQFQDLGVGDNLQFILIIPAGFAQQLSAVKEDARLLRLEVSSDVKQEVLTIFRAKLSTDILRLRLGRMKEELAPFVPDIASRLSGIEFTGDGLIDVHFTGMEANQKPTSTQQSVPSWIVFGMFFVIIPMSTIFINERRQNTLTRMSAMNITIPALFAGKIIPYLIINHLQVWLMIGVGVFLVPLLGGDALTLGHSVTGLIMVSLGLSLAAIGTSVLIAVLAETVEQATTIGGLVNILLGAIGGIMVPKFYMPKAMQDFANISPMSWGLEGFLDIFLRGLGPAAVLKETLALAACGCFLLLLAGVLLSHKMRRGV
ncbi:MAG: ABC transporter permease [Desulfobulbus sp.]|nr:MAG: ABC transporter permease [Desulfobulbus sp.]RUM39800.1 MAG: ABC transporter permease [Desulfobulbus sp.]